MRRPGATSTVKPLTNSQRQSRCTARRVLQPRRSTAPRVSSPTLLLLLDKVGLEPIAWEAGRPEAHHSADLEGQRICTRLAGALPQVHCEKAETLRQMRQVRQMRHCENIASEAPFERELCSRERQCKKQHQLQSTRCLRCALLAHLASALPRQAAPWEILFVSRPFGDPLCQNHRWRVRSCQADMLDLCVRCAIREEKRDKCRVCVRCAICVSCAECKEMQQKDVKPLRHIDPRRHVKTCAEGSLPAFHVLCPPTASVGPVPSTAPARPCTAGLPPPVDRCCLFGAGMVQEQPLPDLLWCAGVHFHS